MADLGSRPGDAAKPADGALGRQRLDPRSVIAGRLGGWTFTGVVLIVAGGGALATLIGTGAPLVSWLGTGAVGLLFFGGLALLSHHTPRLRYETTRVGLDVDGLEFEHGWLWRHQISVPRSRIQHTDVTQGPYERRFGLATLVVYTAGTEHASISIEGLSHETALAFRDALLARGSGASAPDGAGDAV
jgi:membrane protein YdbS with pleckstrin-like domain